MTIFHKKIVLVVVFVAAVLSFLGVLNWLLAAGMSEDAYRAQAQRLADSNDWTNLYSLSKKWATDYPGSSVAYAALGDALRKQGDTIHAVEAYEHSLRINRNNPHVWSFYGAELFNAKRYQEAAGACLTALNMNPGLTDAWFCLGLSLAFQGDQQKLNNVADQLAKVSATRLKELKEIVLQYACPSEQQKLGAKWCPVK